MERPNDPPSPESQELDPTTTVAESQDVALSQDAAPVESAPGAERELLESEQDLAQPTLPEWVRAQDESPALPRWRWALYAVIAAIIIVAVLVLSAGVAESADAEAGVEDPRDLTAWIKRGLAEKRRREAGSSSESSSAESVARPMTPRDMAPGETPRETPRPSTPTAVRPPVRAVPDDDPRRSGLPLPVSVVPGELPSGPKARPALPPLAIDPISTVEDDVVSWFATLDLLLAWELEFADVPPTADPRAIRTEIFHHLIRLSVRVGHTDNPRDNLDAIRGYVTHDLGLEVVNRTASPLKHLRPSRILTTRRGTDLGIGLLALVLADRINPYLELEPVRVGSLFGLRYRSNERRFTYLPEYPDRLRTDRELVQLAYGSMPPAQPIQTLSRREMWGWYLGATGAALFGDGEADRGREFVHRGLGLYSDQAGARMTLGRIHLDDQDLEAAREEFDRAVEIEPWSHRARRSRADLLLELGDDTAAERDLVWLARYGKDPNSGLDLAEFFLESGRYVSAMEELEAAEQHAPEHSDAAKRASELRPRILAAPWLRVLSDPRQADTARFEALRQVSPIALPDVDWHLAQALEDRNQRLARLAWRTLGERTSWELPFERRAWRRALLRRDGADLLPAVNDPALPLRPEPPSGF